MSADELNATDFLDLVSWGAAASAHRQSFFGISQFALQALVINKGLHPLRHVCSPNFQHPRDLAHEVFLLLHVVSGTGSRFRFDAADARGHGPFRDDFEKRDVP